MGTRCWGMGSPLFRDSKAGELKRHSLVAGGISVVERWVDSTVAGGKAPQLSNVSCLLFYFLVFLDAIQAGVNPVSGSNGLKRQMV